MTEPQVQYTKTSEGVSIAFASMGEGPMLIRVPQPGITHVQRDWTTYQNLFEQLTRHFHHVWYDTRGTGLSDRSTIDFSMDAMVGDLEAVIDRIDAREFALLAFSDGVPVAVTYASQNPDRVSHLILIDGWITWADSAEMPSMAAHEALIEKDWKLFTETMMRVLSGVDEPQLTGRLAEHMRASIDPDAYREFNRSYKNYDGSASLGDVKAPTLVLHNNNNGFYPLKAGQRLAAGIPNARFMAMDDPTYQGIASLVEDFVGVASPAPSDAPSPEPGGFRTILFTDLVGHSEMMSRLGDARGREILREHERISRDVFAENGGTEVKTMGDGFMASFTSVTRAVECAIALQRAFADRDGEPLSIRVGLNAGEPIEDEGDLFGATVIIASRIAAKAEGGEILVANAVRELCSGKGFMFADRGEFVAKGFEDPVRVYEVSWREE
jgi:class 3 adenylate cyclase/pimeloyl-ACP methyl ester carboxylesterase